jgi:hypothetical protein
MKTISHRALAALVFGFLMSGGSAVAQDAETGHGCGVEQSSCCSSCCATQKSSPAAYNEAAERFRAKYGREYPDKRPTAQQNNGPSTAARHCC